MVILGASTAAAATLMPSGTPYLNVGIGAFNLIGAVNDDSYNHTLGGINAEYQLGYRFFGVGCILGLLANTDGDADGYWGLYADVPMAPHWILAPEAAVSGIVRVTVKIWAVRFSSGWSWGWPTRWIMVGDWD